LLSIHDVSHSVHAEAAPPDPPPAAVADPIAAEPVASTESPGTPKRRKSLFKMNITWGDQHAQPHTPRKLKKKVSFRHPAEESDAEPLSPFTTPLMTPALTPRKSSGGLKSAFRRLGVRNPSPPPLRQPSPTPSDGSDQSWHHHDRYFPEYEPLFPTTPASAWTNPYEYALTPDEIRRQHQQAVLGQAVAIHYPELPRWQEYAGEMGKAKNKAGWQSGKWGTEGWTGYGWEGESLPTADGLTFGAPMPNGVAILPPVEGAAWKKKKGTGGTGGGSGGEREGEEWGAGEGGDEEGGKDEAQVEAAGGGGGGGGKKKNKKK
jgi:hypothetical protein